MALIAALALVASAAPLDLEQARELAVRRALDVQQAEAAADIERARAGIALGAVLPAVVAFADGNLGQGFTSFGFERPVPWQLGVGVEGTWRVIAPASWAAATAARRSARGREALALWARVEARRQATVAYADAWAAATVVEVRQRAADDAAEGARATASLVEAGLRPQVDRARAEAEAARARAALAEAEADAVARCAALQGLVVTEVDGRCELAPVGSWEEPRPAEGAHPAIVASREAYGAVRAERGAALWSLGPAVLLRGNVAEYFVADRGSGLGWSVGGRVETPITSGGAGYANVRAASAGVAEAEAALAAQEQAVRIGLLSAEARLHAARRSLDALEQALDASEEAFRLSDERYRAGLDGVTPWLDARRVRDESAAAAARGRAAVGAALAEVEAARGVF